jgi:hypothetical protein
MLNSKKKLTSDYLFVSLNKVGGAQPRPVKSALFGFGLIFGDGSTVQVHCSF